MPNVLPVTIPVVASIEALELLALHVPPGVLPDKVTVPLGQTDNNPAIGPAIVAGLMVTTAVVVAIPQAPDIA